MLTLGAFLFAIALLVTVHEWGHFAMARACGVRVLMFSIGFGPRVLGWTSRRSGTVYQMGLLPLGGFVKMLDEREAPVSEADLPYTFNRKPLKNRAAVVAAGPLANLCLALLLYTMVNWLGVTEPAAIVSRPPAASLADKAGFVGGEQILRVGYAGESPQDVRSFEDFRWWLTQAALGGRDLQIEYQGAEASDTHKVLLATGGMGIAQADASMFETIGFGMPYSPPRIGTMAAAGAAIAAGLQSGDRVLQVDGMRIADATQLRDLIRHSGSQHEPTAQQWQVMRAGVPVDLVVTPRREWEAGQTIGRVGAVIGAMPTMVQVRYDFLGGVQKAGARTWEVSILTLRMVGQIATGVASVRNLSGPVMIADYAGRSAAMGLEQFMVFLALISISLGVLNLLPLPPLDGGHLMYYGWEGITGRTVPEAWLSRLQRLGFAIVLLMTSIALFNDVSRLLS